MNRILVVLWTGFFSQIVAGGTKTFGDWEYVESRDSWTNEIKHQTMNVYSKTVDGSEVKPDLYFVLYYLCAGEEPSLQLLATSLDKNARLKFTTTELIAEPSYGFGRQKALARIDNGKPIKLSLLTSRLTPNLAAFSFDYVRLREIALKKGNYIEFKIKLNLRERVVKFSLDGFTAALQECSGAK